jgi:hypothetical protein
MKICHANYGMLFKLNVMCNVLTDKSVKDSESIGVKTNGSIKSEGKKDAVSAFGSITAQLMDGMAMSLSQFGETGECDEGMSELVNLFYGWNNNHFYGWNNNLFYLWNDNLFYEWNDNLFYELNDNLFYEWNDNLFYGWNNNLFYLWNDNLFYLWNDNLFYNWNDSLLRVE